MGRSGLAVGASLCVAVAVAAVQGSAGAQSVAAIVVQPTAVDPGGTVTVTSASTSPCPPPSGTVNPSASVDLYASGLALPVNPRPFQGMVATGGAWSVQVLLAPDIPPGPYRVQAGCYTDSGLNSGFGPSYTEGRLDVRLTNPGQPSPVPRGGRPGDNVQVGSGTARCTPPLGSPSPRVRVSFQDDTNATRAETEGTVDARSGTWTLGLRVPDLKAQTAQISAVCLARVGAPAPYARYTPIPFTVEAIPEETTTTTSTLLGPTTSPPPTVLGATTTTPPTTSQAKVPTASLPPTPTASAVVAEPTYTG